MISKLLPLVLLTTTSIGAMASVSSILKEPSTWTDEKQEPHRLRATWGKTPLVVTMIYGDCRKASPNLTFVKLREIQKVLGR